MVPKLLIKKEKQFLSQLFQNLDKIIKLYEA